MAKSVIIFLFLTIALGFSIFELYNHMALYTDQVIMWQRMIDRPTPEAQKSNDSIKTKLILWILLFIGFILFYLIFYIVKAYQYLQNKVNKI